MINWWDDPDTSEQQVYAASIIAAKTSTDRPVVGENSILSGIKSGEIEVDA
jgi:hypothetical protein